MLRGVHPGVPREAPRLADGCLEVWVVQQGQLVARGTPQGPDPRWLPLALWGAWWVCSVMRPPKALIPYECHLKGLVQEQSRPLPWAAGQGYVSEAGLLPARTLLGILVWARGPFPSFLCSLPSLHLACPS